MKIYATKILLLGVLAGLCALVAYHYPLDDRNGRGPREVVSQFITAVNARNFHMARDYWSDSSIINAEQNFSSNFDDLCIRLFSCEEYTLGRPTRQKDGLFSVGFRGVSKGKVKNYSLYLRRDSNQWLIIEDLWIRSNTPSQKR